MQSKKATVANRQRNKAASARQAGPAPAKPRNIGAGGTELRVKVARSAETGRMVSKQQAKADPRHTVVETIKRKSTKAKPQDQEQLFVLVPANEEAALKFLSDGDGAMTKGELLSALAEEVLSGPDAHVTKLKPFKIPGKLAAAVDMLYTTRRERLDLNRHVEAMKVHERALREHLIDNLPKSEASGVAGKVARAQVHTEDEPQAVDWDEFYKHLKKKGEFELMNKAINRKAIKERWANGKEVPGIGHFENVKLSLTKVGG